MKKRTYIQPSMSVAVINARFHLLAGSPPPKNKFIDEDDSDYEWDDEGAN